MASYEIEGATENDLANAVLEFLAGPEGEDGMTTSELACSLGRSQVSVRAALRRLDEEGRLIRVRVRRRVLTGHYNTYTGYKLRPPEDSTGP